MKVLLIQPPHYYQGKSRKPSFFPIGIGYIAKVIINAGFNVEVLDIYAHQYTKKEVLQKINNMDFNVVGISAMSTQYNYVKWLASVIKQINKNAKIVLGGALASFNCRTTLQNTDIDICVIGEGERTVVKLMENLNRLQNVKGICFKKGNKIVKTPEMEYIKDPDEIDHPAYELFPMDIYFNNSFLVNSKPNIKVLNIVTGRGCPFNCHYCSKVFKGTRLRSIDNVIDELKYVKQKYQIGGVFFNDELLVVNKKRVYELCEKIKPLNLKWNCQGRVDRVDIKMLKCMKKAGCTAIGYGIESGSQAILNNMNKKITVEQTEKAIRDTIKIGLEPIIQLMFGYPGETRETIQETIDLLKRIDHPGDQLSPVTPLPGTQLWNHTLKKGLIRDEREFLERLDGGYMPDAPVLVNYTSFSNHEYDQLRKETEQKIRHNYYKRHPMRLVYKYFLLLRESLKVNGYRVTLKKVFFRLFCKFNVKRCV